MIDQKNMELLYVWISKYNSIYKQGFNFSPKYHFAYDQEKDQLSFEEFTSLPENFWGDNILNLTLLLGKNGAGKTSVLEYLHQPYLKDLFVFKEGDELVAYHNDRLLRADSGNYAIKKRSLREDQNGGKVTKLHDYFDNISRVYYCPIFRGDLAKISRTPNNYLRRVGQSQIGQINPKDVYPLNISTDALLYHSLCSENHLNENPFYIYHVEETIRQLWFLTNKKYTQLCKLAFNKKMPRLEISAKGANVALEFFSQNTVKEIRNFFNIINQIESPSRKQHFVDVCLVGLIKEFLNSGNDKTLLAYFEKIRTLKMSSIREFYIEALNLFDSNTKAKIEKKDLPRLIEDIANKYEEFIIDNGEAIVFPSESLKQLKTLEPLLKLGEDPATAFNYRWAGLSSGELFLLTLFSRINNIGLKYKGFTEKKVFMFCIDEGETALHPYWQKQYIKWLTDYIPMMFPKSKIQFLIATNNPIIASDIPSSNILFLDVDSGKTIVRDKPLETHNTFAANIHTLYRESFFLEDGVMGKFAKDKINNIIDDLTRNNPLDNNRKNEIKQIIQIVGEPILKEKLTQLYYQKYRLDYDQTLEGIIDRLKKLEDK